MLKPEQVPTDVLNAFGNALLSRKPYHECIAAAINAWPGMQHCRWNELNAAFTSHLILPLPKEGA